MEVYHVAQLPWSDGPARAWAASQAQHAPPLVAAASDGNAVVVSTPQGEPWGPARGPIRNVRCSPAACLAWQPQRALLAIAWQDGAVSLWDAAHRHLEEDSKVHRQRVTQLAWHASGRLLCTADASGKVAVWEVNQQLQPCLKSSALEKGGAISAVVWAAAAGDSPAGLSGQPPAAAAYALAAPGSSTVTLKWLDAAGRGGVVLDLGEAPVALLHYEARDQLVVVAASGTATVLARGGGGGGGEAPAKDSGGQPSAERGSSSSSEWSVLLRVKVAGTVHRACWAGRHTLALAGGRDSCVRLWQLDTDDSASLDVSRTAFRRTGSSHGQAAQPPTLQQQQGQQPQQQAQQQAQQQPLEGVTALAYQPHQRLLAAATRDGRVCLFRDSSGTSQQQQEQGAASEPGSQWEPLHCLHVGAEASSLQWGPSDQLLAAECPDGLRVGHKALLHHKLSDGLAAVQVSASRVLVEPLDGSWPPVAVHTHLQLAGVDVSRCALLLHDGRKAEVHRLRPDDGSTSLTAQFESPGASAAAGAGDAAPPPALTASGAASRRRLAVSAGPPGRGCAMALHGDCLLRTADACVEVCSLAGVVRQSLVFEAAQGQPLLLDTHDGHLAVLTSNAHVRVFSLAGGTAKPHAGPGRIVPPGATGALHFDALRVNCDGSMVAGLAAVPGSGGCRDSRLFVYSAELNAPLVLDLAAELTVPRAVLWDCRDPRLLAVQTAPLTASASSGGSRSDTSSAASRPTSGSDPQRAQQQPAGGADAAAWRLARASNVAVCFATPEGGVLLEDYQDLPPSAGCVGVCAPHLLLHAAPARPVPGGGPGPGRGAGAGAPAGIARVPLRCFAGLPDADAATRQALLDFNCHLALGRPDAAFRAVAALRSPAVWRSMAHMAIKRKRLDVAEHCLGNMQHTRGARALREGADEPELDARVGLVAVQLGLASDAARLFAGCARWDLVEALHSAGGSWDEALKVASQHDRLRLQSVHHAYARHLEAVGDTQAALQHYAASGTAATEVPRMLWQQGDTVALERHVLGSSDPGLLTWWARACEAGGTYPAATSCYQRAGNQLAVLRVHCACGDWAAAEQLVASCGSQQQPAAAFHLARVYEAQGRVEDALRCYSTSKRFSFGARLAKRAALEQELLAFALQSPPPVMLDAAEHLLGCGNLRAAALLFQKGGKIDKALELALSAGLGDVLDAIGSGLAQGGGEQDVMARCAEAFLAAGRHEAAVKLLVRAGQPQRALELLVAHEVALTEELAEALTPDKGPDNGEQRAAALRRIAQAAKAQGLWHLACKKYTQAGDRLKAMRALVRSGDTNKIVFFAGVSRQREVYVMAANHLQTLDWRASPEHLRSIVAFYTKAGAWDSLAAFYTSAAQAEVCQFRAYDRALQALQEAAAALGKSRASDREVQLGVLHAASERMERFVKAQELLGPDPAAAVAICQQLLQEATPDPQGAAPEVRPGDVYGLLVQWCMQQGNAAQAGQLLQQMAAQGLAPAAHVPEATLAAVQQVTGALQLQPQATDARQPPPEGVEEEEGEDEALQLMRDEQEGGE